MLDDDDPLVQSLNALGDEQRHRLLMLLRELVRHMPEGDDILQRVSARMQSQTAREPALRSNFDWQRGSDMQHTQALNRRRRMGRRRRGLDGEAASPSVLLRAVRYLGRYPKVTLLAYGALFVATAAQLAVPQLLENIIDTVTESFVASRVLELPSQFQTMAAEQMGVTVDQHSKRDCRGRAHLWPDRRRTRHPRQT